MVDKQNQKDDLTPNQEYLIAFLVIGLFGLMYWFFMHDNDIGFEGKSVTAPLQVSSVAADNDTAKAIPAKKTSKEDELEARRDAANALEINKAKEAEGAKLLSAAESTETSLRDLLTEQNVKLVVETKQKKEALRKLELAQVEINNTKNESLKLTEIERNKAFEAALKADEAKQLARAERLKVEQAAQKLTQLEMQTEQQKALAENKVASISESAQAEREAIALQLSESQQLAEVERLKAEEAIVKLAELQELTEEQEALNASKAATLADSVKADRLKAEGIAKKLEEAVEVERLKAEEVALQLAESNKALEAERLKAKQTAIQLLALTQKQKAVESEQTALLAKTIEAESNQAKEIALQLEDAKKLAEAQRIKAEETAMQLEEAKKFVEAERIKAEATAKNLAEFKALKEKQEELDAKNTALLLANAEADRLKAEQQLIELQLAKDKEVARLKEQQKRDVNEKIKMAQQALQQQELNRLDFSLASGKKIRIASDSFENTLKNSIINNDTNQAITLDKVNFASGSSILNKESIKQVEGAASILQAYEDSKVLVRGHTDNTGDESKNMALSFNRSMNIKKALVSLGINPLRIGVEGFGSQNPVADNKTNAGRRENRRIDLLLLDK